MEQGLFHGRRLLLASRAGKISWLAVSYLISYAYVGAQQMLRELNAYDKDLLLEYHYRLFKYFESSQRTTDAELYILFSKRVKGEWHIQSKILAQKVNILALTMETFLTLK